MRDHLSQVTVTSYGDDSLKFSLCLTSHKQPLTTYLILSLQGYKNNLLALTFSPEVHICRCHKPDVFSRIDTKQNDEAD